VQEAAGTHVEPRPWWATKSWLAVFFVVASVAGFAVGVFAPIVSQQQISKEQRRLEQRLAQSTGHIENLSRRVEVSKLLFDHYFGKSAAQQNAVITYLQYQFPEDLSQKSLQGVLATEGKKQARARLTKSVAAIKQVSGTMLERAAAYEHAGFEAVVRRDLASARSSFLQAYAAYPTYHNVDEISHKLLTRELIKRYQSGSQQEREGILKDVASRLLTTYAWGVPADLTPRLEAL
jgi:hypothetical protein